MRWPRASKAASGTSMIVGIEHLVLVAGPGRAETHVDQRGAAHQFAKDDGRRVDDRRQAEPRAMLAQRKHQRPHIDLGAHRPEAGDDRRSGRQRCRRAPSRPFPAKPRCARRHRARRGGPAPACARSRFSSLAEVMRSTVAGSSARRVPATRRISRRCRPIAEWLRGDGPHNRWRSDPGNLQSRWAPYVRTHGSGQGQLPRDQ